MVAAQVIGDGVLPSISDARRRLLTPSPLIVPRGSRMYLQPIGLRCKGPRGVALDELNVFRTDQVVLSYPFHSGKCQRMAPGEYEILGPPHEVFDLDWTTTAPGELEEGRVSPPTRMRFSRGGVCNALMLLFTLQMDAVEGMERADGEAYDPERDNDYSSGFDNVHTHWDNPIRFLPVELAVQQGDELQLVCEHNEHDLQHVRLYSVTDAMLQPPGGIGHKEFIDGEIGMKLGVSLSVRKAPGS